MPPLFAEKRQKARPRYSALSCSRFFSDPMEHAASRNKSTQVEFVEDVQPGEIQVSEWNTPSNNGDVSQWTTRDYSE